MIYIIGTGPMALAYAKVLVHLDKEFTVIGRGKASAETFYSAIGVQPITGGIEKYLENGKFCKQDNIIIATGTETLMSTLKKVLLAGAGSAGAKY